MTVVDQQFGGTTPLDVLIDFEPAAPAAAAPSPAATDTEAVFDQFDEFDTATPQDQQKYWFTPEKMARIAAVHNYLDDCRKPAKSCR